ncbi:MAG: glycosyltransferase family 9 protein [Janthinobacterium lividum]
MRILVIKLGALGDVVLAFQPFADIRAHHPGAAITLLTTAPFAGLMAGAPWFDRVVVDARPRWWDLAGVLRLRRQLRGYDRVYDLQTSGRSSRYFRLAGRPAWSGIAAGASLPHANPGRDAMHTVERQREQLAMAGVPGGAVAALDWLRGETAVTGPYALLVPGAAPHRPGKRWPAERFGALAAGLWARGLRPVAVGGASERPLARAMQAVCPAVLDLTGGTTLRELAGLAAGAALAVGNDTGPMHLAAAMGCRGVVLFGSESDPALTAPRGRMAVLRVAALADLPVERVAAALPEAH